MKDFIKYLWSRWGYGTIGLSLVVLAALGITIKDIMIDGWGNGNNVILSIIGILIVIYLVSFYISYNQEKKNGQW